jgi:hypothetical protein
MYRSIRPLMALCAVVLTMSAFAPRANSQGFPSFFIRLFRPYHQVALAQLPEVEKDVKLTDDQKTKTLDLFDKLNEERGALFQDAAGDFDSIREEMAKLNSDIAKEFNEALDEGQRKRIAEIYIQANGGAALTDSDIATALKLTEEQQEKLADLRASSREAFQGVDWQSLGEEEAEKKVDEVIAEQNKGYVAVLTPEQAAEFEKMQGAKLEIDLKNLPNPFGG